MFVQIKKLRYWKSEHTESTCQDSLAEFASRGLFAVADGAGTTLFPALWANIVAQHFVDIPLMSEDPFEVEWWVRSAQEKYKQAVPQLEKLVDWNVRQKAQKQGSDSTLATLRIASADPSGSSVQAELLVFGDSCVIIGRPKTEAVESFILQKPSDFERAPICIPSALKFFNRGFHTCSTMSTKLEPDDIVILATDAVSKWILSAGNGHYSKVWDSFQEVALQTEDSWKTFIEGCRDAKEMIDDDSTALILLITKDAGDRALLLGSTTAHDAAVIEKRKQDFDEAKKAQNKELMAIYFGDGVDLGGDPSNEEIKGAREVADALREVLQVFRDALNSPELPAKVEPVWQRNREKLQNEPCAENLRKSLRDNGVSLDPPASSHAGNVLPALPPEPHYRNDATLLHEPAQSQNHSPVATATTPVQQLLNDLEKAVKDNNTEAIVSTCLALLENVSLEHNSSATIDEVKKALFKRIYADELEQLELARNFVIACHSDDDEALVATAQKIEDARYPALFPFTEEEKKRIDLAHERSEALHMFRLTLHGASPREIVDAYNPVLDSYKYLTEDDRDRLELARKLVQAYEADEDEAIVEAYEKIQFSPSRRFFAFTSQDGERITHARRRKEALGKFRLTLSGASPQKMVEAYDPILDNYKRLTSDELDRLALARQFVTAYHLQDDHAIVEAYEGIERSPFSQSFAFTIQEQERINSAQLAVKTLVRPAALVVTVNGKQINLDQVRNVYSIKGPFIRSRVSQLHEQVQLQSDPNMRKWMEWQIQALQAEADPQQHPHIAVDDLVDDLLIQSGITEAINNGAQADVFDINLYFPTFLEDFKRGANYLALIRSARITDNDLKDTVPIWLRRLLFYWHLGGVKKQLNEWLVKKRKMAKITYANERAVDVNRRREWIQDLLFRGS